MEVSPQMPVSPPPASNARRTLSMVLGSLALVAGLGGTWYIQSQQQSEASGPSSPDAAVSEGATAQNGSVLSLQNTFALSGSYAGNVFGSAPYAVPIGWGYMAPMVAVVGNDFYVPVVTPCDDAHREVHCLNVFKNGTEAISPSTLVMGSSSGETPKYSYQPPSIFYYDGALLAAYWYLDAQGVSTIAIDRVNLTVPFAERSWMRNGTYKSPGQTINYLGSAMARDGTIYLAGWGSKSGTETLELLRSIPAYGTIEKQTLLSYNTKAYVPLYPHVVVKNDDTVAVLFTLQNGLICPKHGGAFTAYKSAAQYEGQWGQEFKSVWSDAPSDSVAAPSTNGSNCNHLNSRFPLDFIYSPADNATYSIVRVQDMKDADPNAQEDPLAQKKPNGFTQKFAVRKNATVLNADIGAAFAPVFASSKDFHAMAMTQLADGTFFLFANNRDTTGPFAVVTTTDFKTFSPALSIPTKKGAGHTIKVGQGFKNTQTAVDRAIFYHSGRFNDWLTNLTNDHLQFYGGVIGQKPSVSAPTTPVVAGQPFAAQWVNKKPGAADWVAFAPTGSPWVTGLPWAYVGTGSSGSILLTGPVKPGQYDLVYYGMERREDDWTKAEVARTTGISVQEASDSKIVLTSARRLLGKNETVGISWRAIQAPQAGDWVGILPTGQAAWKDGDPWFYTKGEAQGMEIVTMPTVTGTYDILYQSVTTDAKGTTTGKAAQRSVGAIEVK